MLRPDRLGLYLGRDADRLQDCRKRINSCPLGAAALAGTGLLVADGTADGALRGGWYLGWRSVFRQSFLTTLQSGAWKVEGFYLESEPRDRAQLVHAFGGNFEYEFEDIGLNTGLLYLERPEQRFSEIINLPQMESLWNTHFFLAVGTTQMH